MYARESSARSEGGAEEDNISILNFILQKYSHLCYVDTGSRFNADSERCVFRGVLMAFLIPADLDFHQFKN